MPGIFVFLLLALFLGSAAAQQLSHPENPVEFQPEAFVTAESRAFVTQLQRSLETQRDPEQSILRLIRPITAEWAKEHATMLSGEHPNSKQFTRRSDSIGDSNGYMMAADYVHRTVEGYGFRCSFHKFRADFGPNIVCMKNGTRTPNELVILGAHLDDIPASGRAPGANDDGSGSASLLSVAQAVHLSNARFERTLVLEWYAGEEQGLIGSRALARERRARGDTVHAMIQQDMVALHQAGDPVGIAFVLDPRSVDGQFTEWLYESSLKYAPENFTVLRETLSGSNCCSDSMSYHEQGYIAANFIEIRGYTGDPQYHKIGDVVNRSDYSVEQIAGTAQVTLAAAAQLALYQA